MTAGENDRSIRRLAFFAVGTVALTAALTAVLQLRLDRYPEGLSGVFPASCLVLLAVFAGVEAMRAGSGSPAGIEMQVKRLAVVAMFALLYVAALPLVGFAPATLLFQAAVLAVVFGRRGFGLVAVPVLLTFLMLAFFSRLLAVPLPRGLGWFYGLNSVLL